MAILIYRRRTVGPVFSATTRMDKVMYAFLAVVIVLGMWNTIAGSIMTLGGEYNYREGVSVWYRVVPRLPARRHPDGRRARWASSCTRWSPSGCSRCGPSPGWCTCSARPLGYLTRPTSSTAAATTSSGATVPGGAGSEAFNAERPRPPWGPARDVRTRERPGPLGVGPGRPDAGTSRPFGGQPGTSGRGNVPALWGSARDVRTRERPGPLGASPGRPDAGTSRPPWAGTSGGLSFPVTPGLVVGSWVRCGSWDFR